MRATGGLWVAGEIFLSGSYYFIKFASMLPSSITIPVINRSTFPLPAYATVGASGLDVRANIEQPITLQSLERTLIPTGLFVEIPLGYEIQVRPRSGLAVKQGLTCLNTPGTIDADYRGEIKVILINLSQEPQIIQPGFLNTSSFFNRFTGKQNKRAG